MSERPLAAVDDPIARNIADILELEIRELENLTPVQRKLSAISRGLARPAFPIGLLILVAAWVGLNLPAGTQQFDPPPFHWLQGLLTLIALLTTSIVLFGQWQQSRVAEQRAHMDLQINILTEQKVTKLIHLMEELRADVPGVRERHDPHVVQLKKPTDPVELASALKGRAAKTDARPQDNFEKK